MRSTKKAKRGRPSLGDRVQIVARVPVELLADVERLAAESELSRNAALVALLEGGLRAAKRRGGINRGGA